MTDDEIILDSREDPMVRELMDKEGIKYRVEYLPVGDFFYEKKGIVIERKTYADFVNSMRGGHLQKQLMQMQQFENRFLIISGDVRQYAMSDPSWTGEHHTGAIVACCVRYGVQVLQFTNDIQLVKAVKKIVEKSSDGREASIYQTELFRVKHDDMKIKLLMCFSGIGEKKAKKLIVKDEIIKSIDDFLERMKEHGVYKHQDKK